MDLRLDPTSVAWRDVEGEVVVIDLKNSEFFSLNDAAQGLWPLLHRGTTNTELVQALVERYDVDLVRAESDVRGLLVQLRQRGFLAG